MWYIYTIEYYSAIKKNNAIYSNVDGPRDYHTKQSKPEKDKYMILFICGILKNDTNELIYKQTQRHRKQTYGYQGVRGVGRDKLGDWD